MSNFNITEVCPCCDSEITMVWDVATRGYKAYCPVCGERLMLCDSCQHRKAESRFCDDCDYNSTTDSCRFNNKCNNEKEK